MKTSESSATMRNTENEAACKTDILLSNKFSPKKLESLADVFELLSLAFSFPSLELAEAFSSGSFQADLAACLEELGVSTAPAIVPSDDSQELHAAMKREYSRLYHSPGKLAIIYPYESAFRFAARGGEGFPTLISNPITADVERHMTIADVLPETARKEPVDSVFAELGFLCHLYTQALANILLNPQEGTAQAQKWIEAAGEFRTQHTDTWLPAFMDKTIELSRIPVYRQLAEAAKLVLAIQI